MKTYHYVVFFGACLPPIFVKLFYAGKRFRLLWYHVYVQKLILPVFELYRKKKLIF